MEKKSIIAIGVALSLLSLNCNGMGKIKFTHNKNYTHIGRNILIQDDDNRNIITTYKIDAVETGKLIVKDGIINNKNIAQQFNIETIIVNDSKEAERLCKLKEKGILKIGKILFEPNMQKSTISNCVETKGITAKDIANNNKEIITTYNTDTVKTGKLILEDGFDSKKNVFAQYNIGTIIVNKETETEKTCSVGTIIVNEETETEESCMSFFKALSLMRKEMTPKKEEVAFNLIANGSLLTEQQTESKDLEVQLLDVD